MQVPPPLIHEGTSKVFKSGSEENQESRLGSRQVATSWGIDVKLASKGGHGAGGLLFHLK